MSMLSSRRVMDIRLTDEITQNVSASYRARQAQSLEKGTQSFQQMTIGRYTYCLEFDGNDIVDATPEESTGCGCFALLNTYSREQVTVSNQILSCWHQQQQKTHCEQETTVEKVASNRIDADPMSESKKSEPKELAFVYLYLTDENKLLEFHCQGGRVVSSIAERHELCEVKEHYIFCTVPYPKPKLNMALRRLSLEQSGEVYKKGELEDAVTVSSFKHQAMSHIALNDLPAPQERQELQKSLEAVNGPQVGATPFPPFSTSPLEASVEPPKHSRSNFYRADRRYSSDRNFKKSPLVQSHQYSSFRQPSYSSRFTANNLATVAEVDLHSSERQPKPLASRAEANPLKPDNYRDNRYLQRGIRENQSMRMSHRPFIRGEDKTRSLPLASRREKDRKMLAEWMHRTLEKKEISGSLNKGRGDGTFV
ncbi:MAG: hypothetical protein ACPGUD_13005 [Parashewanella sp.]